MGTTISAQTVADGVGLPSVYMDRDGAHQVKVEGGWLDTDDAAYEVEPVALYDINLTDPQTAFGLALKLDEWERAEDPDHGRRWAVMLSTNAPGFLQAMAERIETIGLDHRIRRAMGWEVGPGTLATLVRKTNRAGTHTLGWKISQPCGTSLLWVFYPVAEYPQIGIASTPLEARRAIAAEVCP